MENFMSELFDRTTRALNASMNMRQLRHSIVSANIANAETPGYQAKKVDFEGALERALRIENLRRTGQFSDEHFPTGGVGATGRIRPDIYENPDGNINNDGNTVDLEREMSLLAENQILYRASTQLINKKLAALKYAISEGGR